MFRRNTDSERNKSLFKYCCVCPFLVNVYAMRSKYDFITHKPRLPKSVLLHDGMGWFLDHHHTMHYCLMMKGWSCLENVNWPTASPGAGQTKLFANFPWFGAFTTPSLLKLYKLLRFITLIVDHSTNWLCREISCFGSGRHAVWPLPRERAEVSTVIPGPSLALSNDQGRCVKPNSVREKVTFQKVLCLVNEIAKSFIRPEL